MNSAQGGQAPSSDKSYTANAVVHDGRCERYKKGVDHAGNRREGHCRA